MPYIDDSWLGLASIVLGTAELAFLVLALAVTAAFREIRRSSPQCTPPVSVMVPAHGAIPGLYECLRSVFAQDYPHVQVVVGLHHEHDLAAPIVRRLQAEFPAVDSILVVSEARIGSNPKVCNLANMVSAAKYERLAMLDSDVMVGADFLGVAVPYLDRPGVGGATCLYKGIPGPGIASRLGALYITDWFIPAALVDIAIHDMEACYGAAMLVTRRSLADAGGYEALANAVAEDDVLGERLRASGHEVCLVPYIVGTRVDESTFRDLWRHELRWMRSVRACRPIAHCLSVTMHALPLTLLALAAAPSIVGLVDVGAVVVARVTLHSLVRRRTLVAGPSAPWLLPLRELLNLGLWLWSFMGRRMSWGERNLLSTSARRMTETPDRRGSP